MTWPLDMIEWALEKVGHTSLKFRHVCPIGRFNKFEAVRDDVQADPVPFVWIEDHWFSGEQTWCLPTSELARYGSSRGRAQNLGTVRL
jgi:hypothetical protein